MPESTTFQVTTRHKLAKGETGITTASTVQIDAAMAIGWILDEFPDDSFRTAQSASDDPDWAVVTLTIDWSKVPDSIRAPKLPARRR